MSNDQSTKLNFAVKIDYETILSTPILDIAARFWEPERYEAFKVCYRSMRRIDDLVDDLKTQHGAVPSDIARQAQEEIQRWAEVVRGKGKTSGVFDRQFVDVLDRFSIPFWPWERLGRAMIYDLHHQGFASFHVFLRYSEGAAISPAAVFMHLCGLRKAGTEFLSPRYDIRNAARHLAIFSYLVHIIRDFAKDQRAGLNYFAGDLLERAGLTSEEFHEAAINGKTDQRVRSLMQEYRRIALRYQVLSRKTMIQTTPFLGHRYQLSLELIYSLYSQIFELFDPQSGQFSDAALAPSAGAIKSRIEMVMAQFRSTSINE